MTKKIEISTVLYGAKDSGTVVYRDNSTMGYEFYNSGNCVVSINNLKLSPGSTYKSFERGYIDVTQWRINFDQTNIYSGCATNYAELTVLIYSER